MIKRQRELLVHIVEFQLQRALADEVLRAPGHDVAEQTDATATPRVEGHPLPPVPAWSPVLCEQPHLDGCHLSTCPDLNEFSDRAAIAVPEPVKKLRMGSNPGSDFF